MIELYSILSEEWLDGHKSVLFLLEQFLFDFRARLNADINEILKEHEINQSNKGADSIEVILG